MKNQVSVVDLFCGIGGLSHGFVLEKFDVLAGIDFDGSCKYAYEKNNSCVFIEKDLTLTHSNEIGALYPKNALRILVGCAPCQAFSTLSQKYKDNDKWKLLYSFSRIIKDTMPEIISMENVPNLLKYSGGEVFKDFLKVLEECEYNITYKILNAADYGVPQNRNRLILIASRLGKVEFIKPTHTIDNRITVKDVIGKLPPIGDGESHSNDIIHRSRKLSVMNKKRIRATKEGGSWKDWPSKLQLPCHQKESGKTYRSVYGRMKWNDVSPTLTTQCTGLGNGRYGHPEQHRAISLREAALLQSFPRNYEFIQSNEQFLPTVIERHIGNAVPVNLGRMIAKSIKKHIKEHGYKISPPTKRTKV